MKITKTTWVAIAVGVVLIGGICLFTALNQQSSQKNALEKNLSDAKQKLALADNDKLIAQRDLLKTQADNYTAQTVESRNRLGFPDDNIKITESLILNAIEYDIELLDIRSPGPGTESLGGVKYDTMSIVINARGTTRKVADFVYSLKKVFPTCIIRSLSLSFTDATRLPAPTVVLYEDDDIWVPPESAADESPADNDDVTVNINMVIYNYKGNR